MSDMKNTAAQPLLQVKHLRKQYKQKENIVQAVDDVDICLQAGEILGVVGESGCGKSTLAKCILGMHRDVDGEIIHHTDKPQMVFQDPYSSLNPSKKIGWMLNEPLLSMTTLAKQERLQVVKDIIVKIGLDESYLNKYPSYLSGGQRQRIAIALAVISKPKLVIADEPVSALDVTVQAQILRLLADLKKDFGLSYMFISHDLNVIYQFCDRVLVMKNGKIVEDRPTQELFDSPEHEYTKQLLKASE